MFSMDFRTFAYAALRRYYNAEDNAYNLLLRPHDHITTKVLHQYMVQYPPQRELLLWHDEN